VENFLVNLITQTVNYNNAKIIPYLQILKGLFIFFMGIAVFAGTFRLIGLVLIIESVRPEKWDYN
jgi:hypothetical protein